MEDTQLDSEIRMLEFIIAELKRRKNYDSNELAQFEERLKILKEKRSKPNIIRMLDDAEMHHVSGRVWSMNNGCFLWMLVFWAICLLLSLPFILSH